MGGERGSVTPLILGFFLIALLMVAGAVLAGDAFAKQRDLQSICDGAALSAADALDAATARSQPLDAALPLAGVQQATADYLARDPQRSDVVIQAGLSPDGHTVHADCHRHVRVAFGAVIGHANGIDEHATASARSTLR
ncbi:MAG: pilus assembly protein TadG-related protein [Jatrophihabitantaceae bacterium]